MKLALIRALLSRRLDAAAFLEQYSAELNAFRTSKDKRGASCHIHVDEDVDLELTSADIDVLCQMYLDDQISPLALEYLTDVLQMSERVTSTSPTISDYLFEFGDPEVNGEFTKARAAEIRRAIAEATYNAMQRSALAGTPLAGIASGFQRYPSASGAPTARRR